MVKTSQGVGTQSILRGIISKLFDFKNDDTNTIIRERMQMMRNACRRRTQLEDLVSDDMFSCGRDNLMQLNPIFLDVLL